MKSLANIAIIIVNYDGLADTQECLKSLAKSQGINPKVIVINASSKSDQQAESQVLRKEFPESFVIDTPNLGFSGNNNVGIKAAIDQGYKYLVLLNNDTIIDAHALRILQESLQNQTVGAISPKIYFYSGREYHHGYKKSELGKVIWHAGGIIDWHNMYGHHRGVDEVDHGQFDALTTTDFCTGCCMAFRAELVRKIGFLDERYFLYWEDTDFSLRTKKAGFSLIFNSRAVVWHKNAGSTHGAGSNIHQYYQTRNRLIAGMIYAPLRTKTALLRESFKKLFNRNTIESKAVVDFFLKRYGKLL